VYYPALRLGLTRWPAMILVFFVSAVFHELVLGVPLHMVRLWAFTGIMLQVGFV
jgi:diacylglycerol O-acyltransferase-1